MIKVIAVKLDPWEPPELRVKQVLKEHAGSTVREVRMEYLAQEDKMALKVTLDLPDRPVLLEIPRPPSPS